MVLKQDCAGCFTVKKPSVNTNMLLQNIHLSELDNLYTSIQHYDVPGVITTFLFLLRFQLSFP